MAAKSGRVVVSSQGFTKASGELISLALATKSLNPRIDSAVDMAARIQCSDIAGAIGRVSPIVSSIDSSLRTIAVAMRERALWAAIAEKYPEIGAQLDLILNGRHGFEFLLMSALGDADGLRQMAAKWPLVAGNSPLDPEIAALKALADERGKARFDDMAELVDSMIATDAKEFLQSGDLGEWSPAEVNKLATILAGLVANKAASTALSWVFATKVAPGVPVASGIISALIELWKNDNNPYLSEETKRQRAIAIGATTFAVGGVAVAGLAVCAVATAGLGALVCVGAVGVASAGANAGMSSAVHATYPEDRHIKFDEFQDITNEARKDAQKDYINSFLYKHNPERDALAAAPSGTPAWFAEVERLNALYRKQAADSFYEQTRYPPRDKVDEYLLEESDRANWHVKMAEISLNN